jgi:hypothetical protein
VSNTKRRTKTRWTRAFKLRALARMDETTNVTALEEELGVRRESLRPRKRSKPCSPGSSMPPRRARRAPGGLDSLRGRLL